MDFLELAREKKGFEFSELFKKAIAEKVAARKEELTPQVAREMFGEDVTPLTEKKKEYKEEDESDEDEDESDEDEDEDDLKEEKGISREQKAKISAAQKEKIPGLEKEGYKFWKYDDKAGSYHMTKGKETVQITAGGGLGYGKKK